MKTKRLIELLQKADPSGELECVVNGIDILSVDPLPGYYDGPYEILVRDEDCPYYNVMGGVISTRGTKVLIDTHEIREALFESEIHKQHFPVEIQTTYANPDSNQRYRDLVERWRKEAKGFREKHPHLFKKDVDSNE